MKILSLHEMKGRRWVLGPWNSGSPVEIGHEVLVSTDLHRHEKIHEYFICLKGWCMIEVDGKLVKFSEGEIMYFEPGDVHKLNGDGSPDFYMLILKYPSLPEDKIVVR